MKRLDTLKKRISNLIYEDNKGAALVMVIIAMAFIGILVSVVCYTSVYNYHMKVNSYKTADSFYSAETALDEIRAGVEITASASLSMHYINVLQSYSVGTSEEKNEKIALEFYKDMIVAYRDMDDNHYNLDRLRSYIIKAPGNVVSSYPIGWQKPAKMYSPKYESAQEKASKRADKRMTLYWNPALKIGADGKAQVSFYTNDTGADMRVEVEGRSGARQYHYAEKVIKAKK